MNMKETTSQKIKPKIHDLSAFKQIMESRAHPLDMLREALSNMMAPEVNAENVQIQHFSHPEYNASFIFKDDGIGMSFTGDVNNPGRLDRFIGLAFSKAAGLKADYWGWKGLGSKLMLNCHKIILETWTGNKSDPFLTLNIINPRNSLLSEPPISPDYYLNKRDALTSDKKGTKIEILGYDGGKKLYTFDEIERYLYWNTALGLTKELHHKPNIIIKVNFDQKHLPIGFKFITKQYDENGTADWRTAVVDPHIEKYQKVQDNGKDIDVKVVLKGGFTLDTGKFGLSARRYNTGLRLSVKGIPYFQLPFYDYKGKKFQQYKDLCSFIIECDAMEQKLNLDRSNISNQLGDDNIVKVFRKLTAQCFDEFASKSEYTDFMKNQKKEDEKYKAKIVRERQEKLTNPNQEYICIQHNNTIKVLHKIPDKSEIDTLAIFWKLEALDLLPFEKFISWEHTKKEGIDVIATFQMDDESTLNNYVPIEFEYKFENFLAHNHNPKQTRCIICWEINNKSLLKKITEFHYMYDAGEVAIPVFEMKNFPAIIIKKYSEIEK